MHDENYRGVDCFLRQVGTAACLKAMAIFIMMIVLNEVTTVADYVNGLCFLSMIFLGSFGGLILSTIEQGK